MSTPDNPFEQIIIPTDIPSAWPPAPIYWLLVVSAVAVFGLAVYLVKRRISKQKVVKQALASLQTLQEKSSSFAQLNQLLKGLSLQYYPRSQVASLTGREWFQFLQQHNSQENTALFNNQDDFCQRLYQQQSPVTTEQEFNAARQWIKTFPAQVASIQKSDSKNNQLADNKHV